MCLAAITVLTACNGLSTTQRPVQPIAPAVAAPKSSILYMGFDNPLAIAMPGVLCSQMSVSTDNGELIGDSCWYILRPFKVGAAHVDLRGTTISGETVEGRAYFRVIEPPVPVPNIAGRGLQDGTIAQDVLTQAPGLGLSLSNFNYDAVFAILSFDLSIISSTKPTQRFSSTSNRFTDEMRASFRGAHPGDAVLVHSIRAIGPNGDVRVEDLHLVVTS